MPKPIESLPNIGPELAIQLNKVGITSAEELVGLGAMTVWRRLMRTGLRGEVNILLALEGAIEGIRWHEIPLERRQELKQLAVSYSQGN
jgi:DNA transformation protein and related proteins